MTVSYLVCATPRSGSTLLCEALSEDRGRRQPARVLRGAPGDRRAAPSARLPGRARRPRGVRADRGRPAAPTRRPTRDLRGVADYAEHLEKPCAPGRHRRTACSGRRSCGRTSRTWAGGSGATTCTRSSTSCSTARGSSGSGARTPSARPCRSGAPCRRSRGAPRTRPEPASRSTRSPRCATSSSCSRRTTRLGALPGRRAAPVLTLTLRGSRRRPGRMRCAHARAHRRRRGAARRAADDAPAGGRALRRLGGAYAATRSPLRLTRISSRRADRREGARRAPARHRRRAGVHLSEDDLLTELLRRITEILDSRHGGDPAARPRRTTLCGRAPRRASRRRSSRASRSRSAWVSPAGSSPTAGRSSSTDIERADIYNPILREKGIRSLLGVPLLIEGRVIGVLHVGTLTPRHFTDDDRDLLQLAADRAALAIEHAQLFEPSARRIGRAASARSRRSSASPTRRSPTSRGRAADRAARPDQRDPRTATPPRSCCSSKAGVPARPRRQGHRGGGRAGRPDPGRHGLRRPYRRREPRDRHRGRRPCRHPQPDPAREGHPLDARRPAAHRGPRARRAARRHAHPAPVHRRGPQPAPARRRPRRTGDRAGAAVRAAAARRGAAAPPAAAADRGHPGRRARHAATCRRAARASAATGTTRSCPRPRADRASSSATSWGTASRPPRSWRSCARRCAPTRSTGNAPAAPSSA